MIKILLVEDDLGLSNSVFDFLDDFADVMQVFDGEEGLYEAESGVYDLILLDLMLPEKDGFQVLKDLRAKGVTTPVLIMTAKESLDDKGHGFELGADDYLTKPFSLKELLARLRSMARRADNYSPVQLQIGNTELRLDEQELRASNSIRLAGKELKLLQYFMQNSDKELSRRQILERVWSDEETDQELAFIYVSYLRQKLKSVHSNLEILGDEAGPFQLTEKAGEDHVS